MKKTAKNYGPGSISEKAKERLQKEKDKGKSQSAKNISNRADVEANKEVGFTRGVTVTKTKR